MDLDIRPAIAADFEDLAAVARACGLSSVESGADTRYVSHLRDDGRLLVARDSTGHAVGFAASIPVGDATMLTDLFVRPDVRNGGVGAALLAELFRGVGHRMTHSSGDPRALALYARNGMTPVMPLLYLRGNPLRLATSMAFRQVPPHEAAAIEATITGIDRAPSYAYWAARPDSLAFSIAVDDWVVGAGVMGGEDDEYGLTHLAVAPEADAATVVIAAVAAVPGGPDRPVRLVLPGPHPALRELLDAGFHIIDSDTFMTSGPNPYASGLAVGSPGLC